MTTLTSPSSRSTGTTTKPATKKSPTKTRRPVFLVGGVVLVTLVLWAGFGWGSSGGNGDDLLRATVVPRSFTVSLKEKGELKAAKSADVKCEVEGRSTIISLVAEGTSVNKGDLLVELASDAIENRIREAELKETNSITAYESAKTELDIQRDKNSSDIRKAGLAIELRKLAFDKYQKGEWVQASKDAQIAIEQAEMSLERREQDFIGAEKLFEKNFTTRTEFEEMKFNFQKAKWNLQKAELAQDVLERYTHVADLKQRQSDVEEAIKEAERVKKTADGEELRKARNLVGRTKELELIQDQLAKLRQQRTKCRIYAPTQGFVVYYSGGGRRFFMSSDQQIKVGAQVIERQVLIELPDTSVMLAVVRVHETKTDRLRLGQKTVLTVEGFPGRRFTGTVTKIAVLADSQSSWLNPDLKEYETEITLDPTDAKLKPGVTAHAEILVDTIDDLLGCLNLECLAFDLLLKGLSFVVEQITAVLEGGGPKLNLPLLGNRLDGGSGVCSSLGGGNEGLLGVLDGLAAALNEIKKNGTAGNIKSEIQDYIFDAVHNQLGLLKNIDADGSDPTIKDVEVTILCDADAEIECKDDEEICLIDDIRVRFRMGQGVVGDRPGCTGDENDCPPGATDLPFDLGIPGVPMGISGALEAKVGWQYLVDFGLSRTDGPYLAATGPGHDEDLGEAELIVGASVGLLGTELCDEDAGIPELDDGYSTNACLV
ncbi:MAG: efflux RND transporter periplasmic adaptor subunit, partial [Planctomycetes bacterium]|nr:efflux RND transporter periplasmic adaptor subunit [Planctomycetota bacterium]